MRVIGLTGSIGMGKSTTARMLRRLGVPLHDADAAVHRLTAPGGPAVAAIGARFPGVVDETGAVDRKRLGACVFGDTAALKDLEAILHPLVRDAERRFLQRARRARKAVVAIDIPLLFETGGENRCDAVWVASAPPTIQSQRVLRRPGMSRVRLEAIRARQIPDAVKRKRADLVIPTGLGMRFAWNRVVRGLARLKAPELES
jgi:dephospho-CoA kinase